MGFVQGPRIDQPLVPVGFGEGPQGQAPADHLLVGRVDVTQVTDVGGHDHARVGRHLHRERLSLPEQRHLVRLQSRVVPVGLEWRDLHIVERHAAALLP